jgi:16S rRNA A1518/A1519 N6-dimethyltransferase RsmA/KsgA/DIM1 with predicted DNA glycosylase/AP lyase activity
VLRLDRIEAVDPVDSTVRLAFSRFLRALFGVRRKTLRSALRQLGHPEDRVAMALEAAGLATSLRPEQCGPPALFGLYQEL